MRIISILIIVIGALDLSCQSLSTKVLSSAGGNYSSSGQTLVWTLGELSVSTYTSNTLTMSEGFHQNYRVDPSTALSSLKLQGAVDIFPNPVAKNLQLTTEQSGKINYAIIDIKGRRIQEGHFKNSVNIPVHYLDAGQYLIILSTLTNQRGVYTFVKSQ